MRCASVALSIWLLLKLWAGDSVLLESYLLTIMWGWKSSSPCGLLWHHGGGTLLLPNGDRSPKLPLHSKTTLVGVLNSLLSLVRLEAKLPLSLANRAMGGVDIFFLFFHTLWLKYRIPCLTKPPFFWFLAENSFGGDHWCFWYSSFFNS